MKKISTILFDLDGTLLDTAPDLATALNVVSQNNHRARLPFEKIRPFSSTGTRGLLGLGFQITEEDPQYAALREQFLAAYHQHLMDQTKIFPGILEVLAYLEKNNIHWGVVTNKPEKLAKQLLENFNLNTRTTCIIGGDTLTKRKPDPEPLLHACGILGSSNGECIYVGDAERDITAAKNANMISVAALYGYIGENEDPHIWNADFYIDHPQGIIKLINETLPNLK